MAKRGPKLVTIAQDINPFSLVSEFMILKQAQGVTKFTITSYRSCLSLFFAEYRGNIKDVKKLKLAVMQFLSGKKAGYYNKLLQALRQFFDFCICERIVKENPCYGMRFKKESARIVDHDEATVKALLTLPDQSTFAGLRDYVFFLTMLDTGVRPNELLQICVNDIDFVSGQILIREEYSKTRQPRIIPLSLKTMQFLKRLIQARHEEWSNIDTPVFCSFSGYRLTSHNFQERFREYANKLGVRITPYHLRHIFALWFIRNGGNVFALQKIMGHTKLDMTQTYVSLVQADIKKAHEEASPLNSLFIKSNRVGKINVPLPLDKHNK